MTSQDQLKWFRSRAWWIQALLILGAGAVVAQIALASVPAIDSGGDLVFYLIMLGYSCVLLFLLRTRTAIVFGVILALLCLFGAVYQIKAKQDFHRKMEERKTYKQPAEVGDKPD